MLLRSLTSECYGSNVKIKLSSLIGVIENADSVSGTKTWYEKVNGKLGDL